MLLHFGTKISLNQSLLVFECISKPSFGHLLISVNFYTFKIVFGYKIIGCIMYNDDGPSKLKIIQWLDHNENEAFPVKNICFSGKKSFFYFYLFDPPAENWELLFSLKKLTLRKYLREVSSSKVGLRLPLRLKGTASRES